MADDNKLSVAVRATVHGRRSLTKKNLTRVKSTVAAPLQTDHIDLNVRSRTAGGSIQGASDVAVLQTNATMHFLSLHQMAEFSLSDNPDYYFWRLFRPYNSKLCSV